jgi:hypothetical protein
MKKTTRLTQILPSTRWIGRLHDLEDDAKDRLTAIAMKAYRRAHPAATNGSDDVEPLEVIMAVNKAKAAAEHYISAKQNEIPLSEFRSQVGRNKSGSLRQAVDQLLPFLISDALPPFAQMRAQFCYGDPNANGNEDCDDETLARWNEKEDLWKNRYGVNAIKEALTEWQALMCTVHTATGTTGRPPVTAEVSFVSHLHYYWTHELGAKAVDSRGGGSANQQQGLFAEFVREAEKIIPKGLKPHSLDHAIKTVLGRKPVG